MITGIVKSEKSFPDRVEVFWTIPKLDKKLEEDNSLRSVPFYFAGQMWQALLKTDGLHMMGCVRISVYILRITVSKDETPDFPVVFWNMGIFDYEGSFHYGRTGCANLEMASEWMTVAFSPGPELTHLRLQKDLYMPDDKITIALRLILDSRDALMNVAQDPHPKLEKIPIDVVVIKVKGKTFYAEDSILDGISKDIELKISECITGSMTVIDLPDCDPDAFECFLSFKDSREVEGLTDDITTDDMAREVYDIADKFKVPELKRECVKCILRDLDASSVCGFLEMAERYHDRALKEGCSEFFLENARYIVKTTEWFEFLAARTKVANDLIISYVDSTA